MNKYSIYEVAKELNISHTTVYKKLKNNEVYKLIVNFIIKNEITGKPQYITYEGIKILKKFIKKNRNLKKVYKKNNKNIFKIDTLELEKQFISLQQQINFLQNQINEKDNQINKLLEINKNNQVLLKQTQDKILMLETKRMSVFNKIKNFFKR